MTSERIVSAAHLTFLRCRPLQLAHEPQARVHQLQRASLIAGCWLMSDSCFDVGIPDIKTRSHVAQTCVKGPLGLGILTPYCYCRTLYKLSKPLPGFARLARGPARVPAPSSNSAVFAPTNPRVRSHAVGSGTRIFRRGV